MMHSFWMKQHASLHKTPSNFWQKLHYQQRIHWCISLLATCLSDFSTVLNIDDLTAQRSTISFNSNALSVICENSANVDVCNNKNMFVIKIWPLQSHMGTTIGGSENQAEGVGDVQWCWKYDTSQDHTNQIWNVLYFSKSPINILSITCQSIEWWQG